MVDLLLCGMQAKGARLEFEARWPLVEYHLLDELKVCSMPIVAHGHSLRHRAR